MLQPHETLRQLSSVWVSADLIVQQLTRPPLLSDNTRYHITADE